MTVPDFQTLMLPVLTALGDGQTQHRKTLASGLVAELGLTPEDEAATIPSGVPTLLSRVGWAVTYMAQAGLVKRPLRGFVVITDHGRAVLADAPDRVDMAYLERYPSYVAFKGRKRQTGGAAAAAAADSTATVAPEELLEQARAENRAAVEGEILDRVLGVDPKTFERLVLAVLMGMGYGRSGRIQHSGSSGDAGVDGIISQDPLDLDRVFMQAKRYAPSNSVGRPVVQEFVGALHGAQADRGVFITTSSFTSSAVDYADKVNARVILVDGARLAQLMVRHGVGVQPDTTVTLHRIDDDFFDSV